MFFYPDRFLRLVLPRSFYKAQLVNRGFSLKREAKRYLQKAMLIAGADLNETIDGVLDEYAQKSLDLRADRVKGFFQEAVAEEKLLKNRIENTIIFAQIENFKKERRGEFYRWLPSDAEEPDPEHQLLYGKVFKVGKGDKDGNMPGERYGCRCGIEFLGVDKK